MAISTEVIRKITIQGSTQGVTQATDELNKFAAAQTNVAVVTESTAKRALSAEAAYNRQTLSVVAGARAQADLEKGLRVAQSALAQGVITADEHAKRVGLLNEKYGQLSSQQKATGAVMQDLNGRVAAATGSLGTMGQVLTAFGPAGIAVATVVGTIALALNGMADASHALAEKAQELRRFSEVTGLTTAQVQALRSEASKFGVTGDEATTAIERFTAGFNQLRIGQGELLTQIRRVNPALADQMQMTNNAGDALTLFGKALAQTDDVFQRNSLVKAATGKGGLVTAQFLTNLNVDKLTQSFVAAGRGLDEGLIKKLPQTEIEINKLKASLGVAFTKQFAQPLLDTELAILQTIKSIGDSVANFKLSDDLKAFISFVTFLPKAGINLVLDPAASFRAAPQSKGDTFADRFQPANDNPLKPFTPAAAATSKTLEAQVEDMKKLIAVLGPAATASEQLALKQKELQLAARDAGVSAGVLQRAQAALNAEFALNKLRENTAALGAAATPLEQYTLRVAELDNKLKMTAISQETYNRAVADLKQEQSVAALQRNVATLGSAATAADQYKLKVMELEQQLARGLITQETFNRAVFEANPLVQDLKSNFGELTKGMIASMMAGKSFTDSLSAGLKNLSARLADKAIEQLLSGDFEKAAISAASSIVTYLGSLFTGNSAAKHADVIKSIDYVSQLQVRQIAATQDMASLAGQLTAFDKQANIERMMNDRDGGRERAQLEFTLSEERNKIIADFNAQAVAADKQAAADRLAAQEEINKRIQSMQDRLFTATNDPNTLEGQLAILDRQAQREREDEIAKGGQALVDLEAAQAAERYNVIRTFNDKIVADATATAKQVLDAQTKTAQQIVDYLNNLNVGADSSLSPQQRLAAAQATFNATSALAQGGNVDAYNRFTSDAENLRKAAKDYYASGVGYQAILATIKSTALNLPVVSGSTDPVVAALRDVVTAVGSTTTAVGVTTTAVGTDTTQTAVRLDKSINKLDITADKMSTSVDLLRQIGQQEANVATGWYSRMVDSLLVIAQSTKGVFDYQMEVAHRAPTPPPNHDSSWWNPLTWFQQGGVVGAYAPGGIVGNGIFNRDSVLASYAPGGMIALAGGEGIINAERTRQMGGSAAISMLNSGMMPMKFPAMAANSNWQGGGNGDMVAELRALRKEVVSLRQEVSFNTAVTHAGNEVNREGHASTAGAVEKQSGAVAVEARQARINPKAA